MTRELTGRHVIIILLSVFGVVFAVNGLFAYYAVSGFPGVETKDAYRKGLAFNQQIEKAEALKSLGWTVLVTHDKPSTLRLRFQERDGVPLNVSDVSATLFHPTTATQDKALKFNALSTGLMLTSLDPADKGKRELRITALAPDGRSIEFRRELWIE